MIQSRSVSNLFEIPPQSLAQECLDVLAQGPDVRIERIVSKGHVSPPGFWYDQDQDDWVGLVQGEAVLAWDHGGTQQLKPGDWLLIPAHARHRVEATSVDPPCIWLAVHGSLTLGAKQPFTQG